MHKADSSQDYDQPGHHDTIQRGDASQLVYTARNRVTKFKFRRADELHMHIQNSRAGARKAKKKRRRNKNWSEKRNAKCKQATAMFLTNLPPNCGSVISDVKVVSKRDLFPDITAETKQAKIERKLARKRFKKAGGPLPPKKKISDRLPTPEEIATASLIVEDPTKFRLYDHGHVCIFDKQLTTEKEKQIVADITFTDLKTISNQKRDDLNFLVAFLEKSKKFANSIGSKSRSCGGYMWGIG
ncbi:hypothetical protein PGTUg99_019674 [Puccinia graminis f. sp. tritici]|uniref:Uncharacterized protein n=1 Tax=Puccinia graminis f. sp. tritici TaxID=56615 RepID=A0A5B0LX23_PUCGR|nr:hypothetical protein PGTUg99_019674 [Puccinia graminis f. sp. tritici]